jgi:hypothetical protein
MIKKELKELKKLGKKKIKNIPQKEYERYMDLVLKQLTELSKELKEEK